MDVPRRDRAQKLAHKSLEREKMRLSVNCNKSWNDNCIYEGLWLDEAKNWQPCRSLQSFFWRSIPSFAKKGLEWPAWLPIFGFNFPPDLSFQLLLQFTGACKSAIFEDKFLSGKRYQYSFCLLFLWSLSDGVVTTIFTKPHVDYHRYI